MTKIIYFVTPTNLVKIGSKAAKFIPVMVPTLDFTKKVLHICGSIRFSLMTKIEQL